MTSRYKLHTMLPEREIKLKNGDALTFSLEDFDFLDEQYPSQGEIMEYFTNPEIQMWVSPKI